MSASQNFSIGWNNKWDYQAAGVSSQLDVVTRDTYIESESPTSDTVAGEDLILKVIVPATAAVLVVVVLLVVILCL